MDTLTTYDLDEVLRGIQSRPWWSDLIVRARHRYAPQEIARKIRWGIQRWRRGYSDLDVWNFDHYLARIIPPAMRQLSRELHGVPNGFPEQYGSMDAAVVEWRRILETIAVGFEAWSALDRELPSGERRAELDRQFAEGMRLFGEHFGALWD